MYDVACSWRVWYTRIRSARRASASNAGSSWTPGSPNTVRIPPASSASTRRSAPLCSFSVTEPLCRVRSVAVGPLEGIRVLDVATLLGDFGADVVKVEHPAGDPLRTHGHVKDGHGLWWKVLGRNKWTVTLDLSTSDGQELLRGLARQADVLIENFRPGVLERWGLGYEALSDGNPGLVMLRTTGF